MEDLERKDIWIFQFCSLFKIRQKALLSSSTSQMSHQQNFHFNLTFFHGLPPLLLLCHLFIAISASGPKDLHCSLIRYSEMVTQFEYKSCIRIFGVNYFFTVGFGGTITGEIKLNLSKEEKGGKSEKIWANFGNKTEDCVKKPDDGVCVLQLNDYLQDYVHKTMVDMSDKEIGKGRDKGPIFGEDFTQNLANRMINDLSGHSQFGGVFKDLNSKHRQQNQQHGFPHFFACDGLNLNGLMAGVKDRLTPVQQGSSQVHLSMTQNIDVANTTMTRLNILFNISMRQNLVEKSCFEILAETWEKSGNGQLMKVHYKVEKDGKKRIHFVCSNKDKTNAHPANVGDVFGFLVGTSGLGEQLRSAVMTVATPTLSLLSAQHLLLPMTQFAWELISQGQKSQRAKTIAQINSLEMTKSNPYNWNRRRIIPNR